MYLVNASIFSRISLNLHSGFSSEKSVNDDDDEIDILLGA
jgi:hypothetical protein